MANYNTIASVQAVSASGNVTAETAFGIAPANSVRAYVQIPSGTPNGALDGKELLLRAAILITGGTTTNYTPSVRFYRGDQTGLTTFTNDVGIMVPSAFAVNSVTRLWTCNVRMSWDVTTARLNGSFCHNIDTTYNNWATLTAGLSANVAAVTSIGFFLTGIFSASNANNTAILKYLELDIL